MYRCLLDWPFIELSRHVCSHGFLIYIYIYIVIYIYIYSYIFIYICSATYIMLVKLVVNQALIVPVSKTMAA